MISSRVKLCLLLAFLAGVIAWLPAALAWFAAEDITQLYNVRHAPFGIWSGGDGPGFFRPLLSVLLWAGQSLWGTSPLPFHLLNISLHMLNSLLAGLLAWQWLRLTCPEFSRSRGTQAAFTAGVLFWLWPAHAEPVGWILGLTDVAATLAALGSLAAYLHWWMNRQWKWLTFALALYAVALGCKESIAALPGVVALFHLAQRITQRPSADLARAAAGLFFYGLLALVYLQVRYTATGAYIGGYGTSVHTRLPDDWFSHTLPRNLSHLFLPLPGLTSAGLAVSVLAVGCIIAALLCWRARRSPALRSPAILIIMLILCALVAFIPGITLPVGVFMEGQRFAYFPSALGIMAVSVALAVLLSPRGASIAVWMLTIAGCAGLLHYNIPRYQAGETARAIVRGMGKLPPARTLYVLTTPGTYRDAFIMPHGFLQAARMLHPELPLAAAPNISNIVLWEPGVRLEVQREAPNRFRVKLISAGAQDPKPWIMIYPDPTGKLYSVRKEGEEMVVEFHQIDPAQDKIAYLDGNEWVMVEAMH